MAATRTAPARIGKLIRFSVAALFCVSVFGSLSAIYDDLPTASAQPPAPPTDSKGYVNSPARCAPDQNAVVAGRTAQSLIAICADGRGGYQYHGMRLSDGAVLVLPAKALASGCFAAHADAIDFTIGARKLLLTRGMRVVRDETMVEFRDYRTPSAAPVVQQAANQQLR